MQSTATQKIHTAIQCYEPHWTLLINYYSANFYTSQQQNLQHWCRSLPLTLATLETHHLEDENIIVYKDILNALKISKLQ